MTKIGEKMTGNPIPEAALPAIEERAEEGGPRRPARQAVRVLLDDAAARSRRSSCAAVYPGRSIRARRRAIATRPPRRRRMCDYTHEESTHVHQRRTPSQPEHEKQPQLFPANSRPDERAAAIERRKAYPYRFPRDTRELGGKFTVAENKRRLLRYFYFERRLAQALGSWTLAIPDFEVKIETGRHIFYHADAARLLPRAADRAGDAAHRRDRRLPRRGDRPLHRRDAVGGGHAELLVGVHQVVGAALATAYRHHIDDTDQVTDAPTIRLMKRVLTDYEPMLAWAEGRDRRLPGRRHRGGAAGGVALAHEAACSAASAASRAPMRRATNPSRCASTSSRTSAARCRCATRGCSTFTNTGDYDKADGEPRFTQNTYEAIRMYFMRTQRDEVDAIEAFGTFIWDVRFMEFDTEYQLARITWDEARHTEIGHRALAASGYDPWELPNRLSPSVCRGPMEPEYAMAQINLFGEVAILKTISRFIEEAEKRNDSMVAHIADFIRADERTHVKKGQHILGIMTDMKLQDLELKTRELFTECLVALGAIAAEGDAFILSREEIEKLVGE